MASSIMLFVSVSLAVLGQLLMKRGMQIVGTFPLLQLFAMLPKMIFNPFVFAGLFSFMISAVFWLFVLSRLDLSMAYPLVSFGYIIVVLVSWLIFKENVPLIRWLGVLAICLGVILISRS